MCLNDTTTGRYTNSGNGGDDGGSYVRPTSKPTTYTVDYEVTGTAKDGSFTWQNETGGTEQGDYKVPFKKTFKAEYGQFVYISVQNNYKTGSVTCKIIVNGKEFKSSTSEGAYKIATCSGSVGRD